MALGIRHYVLDIRYHLLVLLLQIAHLLFEILLVDLKRLCLNLGGEQLLLKDIKLIPEPLSGLPDLLLKLSLPTNQLIYEARGHAAHQVKDVYQGLVCREQLLQALVSFYKYFFPFLGFHGEVDILDRLQLL